MDCNLMGRRARRTWLALLTCLGLLGVWGLAGCGGGGGGGDAGSGTPVPAQRLVGEIFGPPTQLASSEFKFTAGYTGDLATSRALAATGRASLLDALFMFHPGGGAATAAPVPDAAQRLDQWAGNNADLLVPGTRVLILDEVFWQPGVPSQVALSASELTSRLNGLRSAVALMRQRLPQVSIGITVTPYVVIDVAPEDGGRVRAALAQALALVDWVATDPYWYGQPDLVPALLEWSRDFHAFARAAQPRIETWLVAQAFKDPSWDAATYRLFVAQLLQHAERYDHIIFYGWQLVGGLPDTALGRFFDAPTRALYARYLLQP